MERSAVYRRALAPTMAVLGVTGILASSAGCLIQFSTPAALVGYWLGVGVVAVLFAFLLIRRQAINAAEPYWSPPTRRVTQAALPPMLAGLAAGLPFLFLNLPSQLSPALLVPVWIILYGCALHSAGFFMPRGMKLFGWGFVLSGCALGFGVLCGRLPFTLWFCNLAMGCWFGAAHLGYSVYLYYTEKSRTVV
jgi:hypothetical protein